MGQESLDVLEDEGLEDQCNGKGQIEGGAVPTVRSGVDA